MSHKPRLALMLGLALVALWLAACGATPTPTPVPPTATPLPATPTPIPPTPTPEPTATPTPLSAEAILRAAFEASQQASSYRFEMDMQMTLGGPDIGEDVEIPMVFAGEVQLPDRMQGTMTMSVNEVDVETQVVVIGDESYVKNPLTDQWQLNTQATTMFNPEDLVMDPEDIQDLELLGEESLGGMPVYHLSGRATLPFSFEEPLGQMEADMLVDYWVAQEDLRLVQSAVEGDMEFTGQFQAMATVSMTMRLFDYDVPLEISAPEIAGANVIAVPDVGPITIQTTLLAPLEGDTREGHVQRGLASLADGRLGLAFAHFERALELRPGWPEALLYRGATLAIDGDLAEAFADLDQAIEAEPDRADAYALRAWAHMRAMLRGEDEEGTAMEQAQEDIARALELDPDLPAAQSLQASAAVLEALALYESEPDEAIAGFETAMADLQALTQQDPDTAAGQYLSFAQILFELNMEDRAWLLRQVDQANARLEENSKDYAAYAVRGLAKLILGSQPDPSVQTLQEAGNDLLVSIALVHDHMPDLANPESGPLQVAQIWDLQEAAYTNGTLYAQVFFYQNPQLFSEFAQMLASYWELHDLFAEIVDDPIVFSVAFSPDGSQIATLSESGPSYLRLWDVATGEKLREVELGLDGMVIATTNGNLNYSPDGERVVVAYTNPVARVIDTDTGEVVLELPHDQSISSVAFSPDGASLATIDPDVAAPVLWDVETGERLLTIAADSEVSTVAFSPDGRQIVGGGETVQVWDAETGALIASLPGYESGFVGAPAISPDGQLLAVPGYPVRVLDLLDETELYSLPLGARNVAFSPDGARLATGGFEAAGVWDARSGELIFLAGHPRGVDSVAWSPDGSLLVTGGPDGRFRVWDAETGAELSSGMAVTLWWEESGE